MQLRKVIERRLRRAAAGIDAQSDVHAVVAANVGERGSVTKVTSSRSTSAGDGAKSKREHPA